MLVPSEQYSFRVEVQHGQSLEAQRDLAHELRNVEGGRLKEALTGLDDRGTLLVNLIKGAYRLLKYWTTRWSRTMNLFPQIAEER